MAEIKLNVTAEQESETKVPDKWEIEDAVRTLIRAEEIKQDAELMKLVAPELKKRINAVKAVDAATVLYGQGEKK